MGDLDLLGEVTGGGSFDQLRTSAEPFEIDGLECWVVTLPKLIALKRAAGRGTDREAVAELEVLLEERTRPPDA